MDSTTFAMLVAVASDYFYMALRATEDFDSFLRTVRNGMREAAVAAVAGCVERFDREVAAQLPRSWELKDRPSRTVATMFGRVTYARSRYRDEHGRSRYPADEILGIPKRKRLTADVFLWLAARAARASFRQTARDFFEVSGVKVSAMCPWRRSSRKARSSPPTWSRRPRAASAGPTCSPSATAYSSRCRPPKGAGRRSTGSWPTRRGRSRRSSSRRGAYTPASARRASGACAATSRCSPRSARPRRCARACAPPSPPNTTSPT